MTYEAAMAAARERFGPSPSARKAATGAGVIAYSNDVPLSLFMQSPQDRMARYLKAFRSGWFYKAESVIAFDVATLEPRLEDSGANEIELPDARIPFASLSPVQQLRRLLSRPNPAQTWRQLIERTQIRLDMAGNAFLYLEGAQGQFTPTGLYGISPARMTPSKDRNGQLIGWVLDYNGNTGSGHPFSAEEVLHISYGSGDDDIWGVGVVEAVLAETGIQDLLARHTADVLQTGGRLAGMLTPKRTVDEGEFVEMQRAWRSVANDPNAARRLLLFPEPMEWSQSAATPMEIGLPDLVKINKENILTAFPINEAVLGVPLAGGLNSGDARSLIRKEHYERTIHPRVRILEEAINVGLVERYEHLLGEDLEFEIEEPSFEDAPVLIERAGAMRVLIDLGFEAESVIAAVGLDELKFLGVPAPAVPDANIAVTPAGRRPISISEPLESTSVGKSYQATRERILSPARRSAKTALQTALQKQRDRLAAEIARTMPASKAARKAAPQDWWDSETEFEKMLGALELTYRTVGKGALQVVADRLNRMIPNDGRVFTRLLERGGERITGINEATREAVNRMLAEGIRRGYSVPQLVDGVPDEGYPGVRNATLDNGLAAFDEYRAEMIARTETASAYNTATLTGYSDLGVTYVRATDGDQDEECAARNDQVFTIDDADNIEDHPNGTLDWIPLSAQEAA